jgi:hypothetical protein
MAQLMPYKARQGVYAANFRDADGDKILRPSLW